jgi:hypothetical protein
MRFSLKKLVEFSSYLYLYNEIINIGVFIDNMLTFNDDVEYVYSSCVRKWTTLKRLCVFTSPVILTQLFKVYTLPLVGSLINNKVKHLNPYKNKSLNLYAIESIYHLSYSQRLSKLDLKPLKVRINHKILKYVFKSIYSIILVMFHLSGKINF